MSDQATGEQPDSPEEAAAVQARKMARGELPAVFVDTWGLTSWRGHLRVTIGEEIGDTDVYRFAFLMELKEAESFANHILRVVKWRRDKDGAISIRDALSSSHDEE